MFKYKKIISSMLAILMMCSITMSMPVFANLTGEQIMSTEDSKALLFDYSEEIEFVEQISGKKISVIDSVALETILDVFVLQVQGEVAQNPSLRDFRIAISDAIVQFEIANSNRTRAGSEIIISDDFLYESSALYGDYIAELAVGNSLTKGTSYTIPGDTTIAGHAISMFTKTFITQFTWSGPDSSDPTINGGDTTHRIAFTTLSGVIRHRESYYINELGQAVDLSYNYIEYSTARSIQQTAYARQTTNIIYVMNSGKTRTLNYGGWNSVKNIVESANVSRFI